MEQLYRRLLEFTGDGVHRYAFEDGRILFANRGLIRLLDLHCEPEALIGKRLDEVMIYVEKPGSIRETLEANGEIHNFEYHFKTLKGDDRWVVHDSFLITEPTGERVVEAIVRDITPLKRIQQQLAAEQERLRVTFQSIGDAVIATDTEGHVVLMNAVAEQLTGCRLTTIRGETLDSLIQFYDELTGKEIESPIRQALRTGQIVELPHYASLVSHTHDCRSIADNAAPIRDNTGQIIGAVLVFRDVTFPRQIENRLRLNELRLEALVHLYEMSDAPPEIIRRFALEEAIRLTSSQIGFLGFVDEQQTTLTITNWARQIHDSHAKPEKPVTLSIADGGWRVEAVNQRKPVIVNLSADGLSNHLCIPIMDDERVVAVIGVANKATPYDESDPPQLSLLMTGMWQLLRRKRTEEELRQHRHHLETLINQRTAELARSNAALKVQIDEYARIEKALRESEERFRLAITSAPLAVFRHDHDLRYTWIHYPKAPFPAREFVGKTDADLLAPEEAIPLMELKRRVLETGAGVRAELPVTYHGFTYYYDFAFEPLRDASGQVIGLTCIALDITERRKAEDQVHRQAELLHLTHDAIFVCDLDGQIQFWNRGAEELYGWSQDEALGKIAHQLLGTHFPIPYDKLHAEILEAGRWEGELEQLTRYGQHVIVSARWALVRDAYGHPTGTLRINNNITERKRIEENLRLSNVELEQFAYVASHDLQEPLRVISGFLQLLQHRYSGKLGPDADEYIRYVVDGAGRMRNLIRDLLEYSRVGRRGRPFAPTDCSAVLKTVIANLQPSIIEKNARVTCDPLPVIEGDSTELTQLFQNLIANALKFHGSEPPEVHVHAEQQHHDWLFRIRDNGIGIDPKDFERIFVIFQRLHGPDEYPGTGIGLALCKKIVERHGGRIWVESTPDKGSTFYFTFPVQGDPAI